LINASSLDRNQLEDDKMMLNSLEIRSTSRSSLPNPIYNDSNKSERNFVPNVQRLNQINKELDEELNRIKINQNVANGTGSSTPNYNAKFMQIETNENSDDYFLRINGYDSRFKETLPDFTGSTSRTNSNAAECIRREGMLKIRDVDQRDKDVVVTYAVLTKDRLSYFVNAKDESSIQGSIELAKIRESLKLINGFPTCFTIKTLDGVSDCSICAESDDSAREWINAVTQNAVNCNTMSALNNLNKRGLLK
jgi:hypothetical protein